MKIKNLLLVAGQSLLLVGIVCFAVAPVGCRITAEGIQIIGGDYAAPVLEQVAVIDNRHVELSFSESVVISDVVISPVLDGISNSSSHSRGESLSAALASACGENGKIAASMEQSDDGKKFTFVFDQETKVGGQYEIFGVVHDDIGNSLTFCVPFTGFNNSIPKVIMTEAQVKYTKATLKTGVVYRSEFVEFLAMSGGNLVGIEFVSASDGESKKYEFPPVQVEAGQIFVLHLRTVGEGCVDESGAYMDALENQQDVDVAGALNLAWAEYSCNGVLDFWCENTAARLNDSADVLILRNNVNGSVMDGLMYASEDTENWKPGVQEYAFLLEDCGIYESEDICNATVSKGLSPKKSLQRVDAAVLRELAMNGEVEYPVGVTAESWEVRECTAGELGN